MLKEGLKQNLILLVFSLLMMEVLTTATLVFVIAGPVTVALGLKANKLTRNILALGIFASYWVTYGKVIDPEVGLNFLTSIIVLKILEKETVRDRYMIFFGLLLLISSGSLFDRTLTYVFFFATSFFVLISDFYSHLGRSWRLRDLGFSLLWVLPFTFFLFFFIPRLLSPIPFNSNTDSPGEIGYTPDVNISELESLEGNKAPVFQVQLNRKLNQEELYWRGNTLSFNDGWNWKLMIQDREAPQPLLGKTEEADDIRQSIRLFTTPDFFFSLDHPGLISYGDKFYRIRGDMKTLPQRKWQTVQRYAALSRPGTIPSYPPRFHYLKVPLSKSVKEEVLRKFSGTTPEEVISSISEYFQKNQFAYSLSPGKSQDLLEFLQKKIGLCSHYASATALILRMKGIPSRLVSGFMGGTYNPYGDFYLVSQNDAHVWVEVFSDGAWRRIDPTAWIAVDRVRLGGEAFMENVERSKSGSFSIFRYSRYLYEMKLWVQQWDFLFYQWLEQMDYYSQEAWLTKFKFKRKWLFTLIPLVMVLFMLFYSWYLSTRKIHQEISFQHELWRIFFAKMKKRGINLSWSTLAASEAALLSLNDDKVRDAWIELKEVSFKGKETPVKDLKKMLKQL